MSRDHDHPLSISHTGSFGEAARGSTQHASGGRSRRAALLARFWPLVSIAFLALGPIAAYVAFDLARSGHAQRTKAAFQEALRERTERANRRLGAYREVLHAVQGLYDASEAVTREEFETFTRQARGRHPCIEALAWAPPHDDGGSRLRYIEPRARYGHLLAHDLDDSDAFGGTLERARAADGPVLSPPFVGNLSGSSTATYGLYALAVHDDGADASAPLRGTVLLSFRFADLLACAQGGRTDADMRLWLFDITAGDASQLAAIVGEPTDVATDLTASHDMDVGGRRWRFTALPTARFLERHDSREPIGIAAVVFLVWELFAGLLLALSHASRSTAVRRQGRNVARIMHSLGEGVVVVGADGRVRLMNSAARALLGGVLDEADLATFERSVRCAADDARPAHDSFETPLRRAMRGEVFDQVPCFIKTPGRPEGVHVHVSGSPLRDEWGNLLGGVLAIRDDTERRRHEQALRDKDAQLRQRALEMELAAEVQKRFYPTVAPRVQGLDIAGRVRPADETCGDYYDYLELPDGSMLLAVGDVSGHGLGPALVMAETRAYVRSLARAGHSPREILERCNRQLCSDLADDLFVTMLLLRVSAGGRSLAFASAGHTPALLVGPDGELVRTMMRGGPPLGIVDDREYPMEEGIPFRADDVLVLMTDGVTEATSADDEQFEEEGVLEVVAKHRHRKAGTILSEIGGALERFAGEQLRRDDVTLVVCKRTASSRSEPRSHRSLSTTWTDGRP